MLMTSLAKPIVLGIRARRSAQLHVAVPVIRGAYSNASPELGPYCAARIQEEAG